MILLLAVEVSHSKCQPPQQHQEQSLLPAAAFLLVPNETASRVRD